ncbi:MAG: FliM/FliN family flagellar motor switch protein [Curvibacter sp.]|nr:FliM/FliN family flagellar motor switch protein [Curvibacter sp.]
MPSTNSTAPIFATDPTLSTGALDAANPTAQLIELPELSASTASNGEPLVQALAPTLNPIYQVQTTLQVCVGSTSLTVGQLMEAKANQVLVLNRSVQEPVDLLLGGQVVARGHLVAVDDHFAVSITELPLPLGLAAGAEK